MKNSDKRERKQNEFCSLPNVRILRKGAGIILVLVLCFAFSERAFAQRNLPGMRAVELRGGYVDGIRSINSQKLGYYYGAGISTYVKNSNRWVFGAEYLQRYYPYKCKRFPVAVFTGEGGYYRNILSDPRKIFFLSLGTSALAGYETSNWGTKTLFDGATLTDKDGFVYGGALTLELESYLTDRFILFLSGRERILFGTSTGHFHTQFGLGIRIMIH